MPPALSDPSTLASSLHACSFSELHRRFRAKNINRVTQVPFILRGLRRLSRVQRHHARSTVWQRLVQVCATVLCVWMYIFTLGERVGCVCFVRGVLRRARLLRRACLPALMLVNAQVLRVVDCVVLDVGVSVLGRLLEDTKLHHALRPVRSSQKICAPKLFARLGTQAFPL